MYHTSNGYWKIIPEWFFWISSHKIMSKRKLRQFTKIELKFLLRANSNRVNHSSVCAIAKQVDKQITILVRSWYVASDAYDVKEKTEWIAWIFVVWCMSMTCVVLTASTTKLIEMISWKLTPSLLVNTPKHTRHTHIANFTQMSFRLIKGNTRAISKIQQSASNVCTLGRQCIM